MRLNHVTLHVDDVDRSVAFYKRLGFIQIVAAEGYARFQRPAGDATLSLESRPGGDWSSPRESASISNPTAWMRSSQS
jgi:catechol 2,3-dioxygenase-like lactoylglutathione lyase family enzyme